jgi:hypothetical protein
MLHSLTTRFTAASIEGEKRKLLRCGIPYGDPDNRSIRWRFPGKPRRRSGSRHKHRRNNFSIRIFFRCGPAPFIAEYRCSDALRRFGYGGREKEQMATMQEIGQEKQKVMERLARLDADREKLAAQLNELEIAERVLTRFGKVETTTRRGRGRPARPAPAPAPQRGRARGQPAQAVSLSDATLRAVQAYPEGATANEVLGYLSREFGMAVRPNHLGIALQRHRRAGRLESRDSRWFLPPGGSQSAMSA